LPAATFAAAMHCVPTQRTKAVCKLSHYRGAVCGWLMWQRLWD